MGSNRGLRVGGASSIVEKFGLLKIEPLVGLFYRCLGVFIGWIILVAVMLKPEQIKSVDLRSASCAIAGGILASFIAQIAFYNSLKTGEVSRVVPIAGSFPLIAFILGVLIFRETITWTKVLGIAAIILGIWALKIG